MTTIYFESNEEDDLRVRGFSKDGRHQLLQLSKLVIIADTGLLSKENIAGLKEKGYHFFMGAKPKDEADFLNKALAINDSLFSFIDIAGRGGALNCISWSISKQNLARFLARFWG